jgi:hypothetical protein
MFKELTLQNIWESVMPVENGSTFKIKSTLWWPTLVEGLKYEVKLRVENHNFRYFVAKLCFALLASLRSISLAKHKWRINWLLYLEGLTFKLSDRF